MSATSYGLIALAMFTIGNILVVLTSTIPGLQVAAMSLFLGASGMSIFQIVKGQPIRAYWHQPASHYAFLVGGVGIYTALIYVAFRYAPPFEVNAINYLWPILLVGFSALFHTGTLNASKIFGVAMGFLGTFLIFVPAQANGFMDGLQSGHFLALIAAILWAAYSALAKNKTYPAGLMAPAMFISAFLCAGLHLMFEETVMPVGIEWGYVLLLGFFRLSYLFWDESMRGGNVVFLASLAYFVPLASTLLFIAFGYTAANIWIGLGAGFIVSGCVVVNFGNFKRLLKQ
ncbi:MAG: DMT family transporter [Rhodospirillales bacterium]|nr:DMT family transporter [Alphaproteobacteria bacterium]MCB9981485.1 DMT family transporter [Rhodospirillales bacterium]